MFIYTSLILLYIQIAIIFRNAPNIKCYHFPLTDTRPLSMGRKNPSGRLWQPPGERTPRVDSKGSFPPYTYWP